MCTVCEESKLKLAPSEALPFNETSVQTGSTKRRKGDKEARCAHNVHFSTYHILLRRRGVLGHTARLSYCTYTVYGLKSLLSFSFSHSLSPHGMLPAGQEWDRRAHAQWIQG